MRVKIIMLAVLGISLLSVTSCKKNDTTPTAGNQAMSAFINGVSFSILGGSISQSTTITGGVTSYGFTGVLNNTSLSLELPVVTTGTYNYSTAIAGPALIYTIGNKQYYPIKNGAAVGGSIVITSSGNGAVSGAFNGTLYNQYNVYDSVVVTNGQFSNLIY